MTTTGASPVRLGGEMLGVAEGEQVDVVADITNLGESVMVDATVHARLSGQCSRCLQPIAQQNSLHISDVFGTTPDFISGDDAEEGDEPNMVDHDRVDITQLLVDEAGLNLPFNPVCEDYGQDCSDATPEPDGVSGEQEEDPIDPRWAALAEKFGGDGDSTGDDGQGREG